MQNIPDWKLLDPVHHAFARRALPVTEQELKGQEWKGKHAHETTKNTGPNGKDVNENGRTGDARPESQEQHERASPEDKAFADAVLKELEVIRSFKNASGKPKGPLKPLSTTPDVWKQLEMRIQAEDQAHLIHYRTSPLLLTFVFIGHARQLDPA